MHWFHTSAYADWMDENLEELLYMRNEDLFLQEVSEEEYEMEHERKYGYRRYH